MRILSFFAALKMVRIITTSFFAIIIIANVVFASENILPVNAEKNPKLNDEQSTDKTNISILEPNITDARVNEIFVSTFASLSEIITAIKAKEITIKITTPLSFQTLIIPVNVSLIIYRPGMITVNAGNTLTINGPFFAERHQVFSGKGNVIFGSAAVSKVYPEWWKANTTPGSTAMTTAIKSAITSIPNGGLIQFSDTDYLINESTSTLIKGINDITFQGIYGKTWIKIRQGYFSFASCNNLVFKNMGFKSDKIYGTVHSVWAYMRHSNFNGLIYDSCIFKQFGTAVTGKAKMDLLTLFATDITESDGVRGDSKDATISNCVFYGDSRSTEFGLRIWSDFTKKTTPQHSISEVIVSDCKFYEFDWDAFEIAGPSTHGVIVNNIYVKDGGLGGVNVDKGAWDVVINNVIIDGLLGNIDLELNPHTISYGMAVSGYHDETSNVYYTAHDIIVNNIEARFNSAASSFVNGWTALGFSMCENVTVNNVNVIFASRFTGGNNGEGLDNSQYIGPQGIRVGMGVHGLTIRDTTIKNANIGIYEVEKRRASSYLGHAAENLFENIKFLGLMGGEIIWLREYNSTPVDASVVFRFKGIEALSDMTQPLHRGGSNSIVDIESADTNGISHFTFEECFLGNIKAGTTYGIRSDVVSLSLRQCSFYGISSNFELFYPIPTVMTQLHIQNVRVGSTQRTLDVAVDLASILSTCVVSPSASTSNQNDSHAITTGTWLTSSSLPTNPRAENFPLGTMVSSTLPDTLGFIGWVRTDRGWKTFGAISP